MTLLASRSPKGLGIPLASCSWNKRLSWPPGIKSISKMMNFLFSKIRFSEMTLAWSIVYIIVDSFFRIFWARSDKFSFAMILRADISWVKRFLTRRTTPNVPTPKRSLTLNISVKLFIFSRFAVLLFLSMKAYDIPSSSFYSTPISRISTW